MTRGEGKKKKKTYRI